MNNIKEDHCSDLDWFKVDIPKKKSKRVILADIWKFSLNIDNTRHVLVHFENEVFKLVFSDEITHHDKLHSNKCDKDQDFHMNTRFIMNQDGLIFILGDASMKLGSLFQNDKGRKIQYESLLESPYTAQETNFESSGGICYPLRPGPSIKNVDYIEHCSKNIMVCSSNSTLKSASKEKTVTVADQNMSVWKSGNFVEKKNDSTDQIECITNIKMAPLIKVLENLHIPQSLAFKALWLTDMEPKTKAAQDVLITMRSRKDVQDLVMALRPTEYAQDVNMSKRLTKADHDCIFAVRLTKVGLDIILAARQTKVGLDIILAARQTKIGVDVILAVRQTKIGVDVILAVRQTKIGVDVILAARQTKIGLDVILAARQTKIGLDVILAVRQTKIGEDVILAARLTKVGVDVILAVRQTKIGVDVILAARLTKVGVDVILAARLTKIGLDVILAVRQTKIGVDVILAVRQTKIGVDVILAARQTKIGLDVFLAVRQTKIGVDVILAVRQTKIGVDVILAARLTKVGVDVILAVRQTKIGVDVILAARLTKIGVDVILAVRQTKIGVDVILAARQTKIGLDVILAVRQTKIGEDVILVARQTKKKARKSRGNNVKVGDISKSKSRRAKTVQYRKEFSNNEKQKNCEILFRSFYIVTRSMEMEKKHQRVKKLYKTKLALFSNSLENLEMNFLKEENFGTYPTNEESDITALKDMIRLHSEESFHSEYVVYTLSREEEREDTPTLDHNHSTQESGGNTIESLPSPQITGANSNISPTSTQESDLFTEEPLPDPRLTGHESVGSNRAAATNRASSGSANPNLHQRGHSQQPKHPQFVEYRHRVTSFRNHSSSRWPNIEDLVHCGFFHAGDAVHDDGVRCFHCDGGLQNWNPDDDPWIEHARWFPNCSYLKKMKGQNFIDMVQQAIADVQAEEARRVSQRVTQSRGQTREEQILIDIIEENRMLKEMQKCILCCDYDRNIVFLPCGHLVLCEECSQNVDRCSICGKRIIKMIKTFR